MKLFLRMAGRNLLRQPRRTFLTVGSIAFGLAVVLWLQCIMAGRSQRIIEMITSGASGHLQLYEEKFFRDREVIDSFPAPPAALVAALPAGTRLSNRVYLPSLASSGEHSSTIQLIGVEPASEKGITNIQDTVDDGAFLEPDADPDCPTRQILLGRPLAEMLDVRVGEKVVLLTQAANGSLGNDLFRVKGIYHTQSRSFDKSFAYAPLTCVTKLGALRGIHETVFHLPDSSLITDPAFRAQLAPLVDKGLTLTDWRDVYPLIAGMVRYSDAVVVIISVMLFSVITMGIVNTLFMSVSERTGEFGVMIALGTSRRQLVAIVALECLILGLFAAFLGTMIGLTVVLIQQRTGFDIGRFMGERSDVSQFHFDRIVYPIIQIVPFLKMVTITTAAVVLSGFVPAYRASRLKPVEAIHSN